jgi:RNA polymerase sigma-70 factor (ECF subfamily)
LEYGPVQERIREDLSPGIHIIIDAKNNDRYSGFRKSEWLDNNMPDYFSSDSDFLEKAHQFHPKLLNLARIKLFDLYDPEDAVSEALLKACGKRGQLRDREKLYWWLKRIVINYCNDILRQKLKDLKLRDSVESEQAPDDRGPAMLERLVLAQDIERILDIMLTLEPEEYSEVVILYYYRKFNYEQISESLDVPVGTVKSRLNRARKSLKEALNETNIGREDLERVRDISRWPDIKIIR